MCRATGIQHDSAPSTTTPSVLTTRFGARAATNDTWTLTGASPSPATGALASRRTRP